MKKYDYAVVGGGSAGVRSARIAASLGKKTVLFENGRLGGTCVNMGCIPKKIYSYAAEFLEAFRDAKRYGWKNLHNDPIFDLKILLEKKNAEISRLNDIYKNILSQAGVDVVYSHASFKNTSVLEAGGETYDADKILLAPGGKPFKPSIPGIERAWVSDDIFKLDSLPDDIAIVGGGYIAVEMASIFNGWGSRVHLLYRGERLLKHFDSDIGKFLTEELIEKGIRISFNTSVDKIAGEKNHVYLSLSNGQTLKTNQILFATGRMPATDTLRLDIAGIKTGDDKKIIVDEFFRTANPNVYAAGDACHSIELTPTAIKQGEMIARNLFEGKTNQFDARNIPSAVFSSPPVATVGQTEQNATEAVDIYYSEFRPLKYSITDNPERTMMKLITSKKTNRVIGIHMVGLYAAEIIQGFAVAIKAGATKEDFDTTVGVHPSSAEEFVAMPESGKR